MLTIQTFPLGPLQTNCYLIHNGATALVVDPGGNPDVVLTYLEKNNLVLERVVCTHLHFDHTYGAAALLKATGVTLFASVHDTYMLSCELGQGGVWNLPLVPEYTFVPLEAGPMEVLGTTCDVLATPGHSPGGLSFYFAEARAVFSGDTLFEHSVGRTDLEGGDSHVLLSSIKKVLFTLPDATQVFPGHGDPSSIGDEKLNNPYAGEFAR